ncbi:MAG TPA: DUF488 domain-containing protein [Terriglobales bacterium]|nr:DUF488 domain-containing protein [Terriglobales bacterium]
MRETVFTIGHSTHPLHRFIALLKLHRITAVGDVRSKPYSRTNPQFNREDLKRQLREVGIAYVFLGDELGARSEDPSCYDRGRVQYDRLARTKLFRQGIERVQEGLKNYRLALMCAEKEPLECHRSLLVARHLSILGITVQHILADGRLESHAELLARLMRQLALPEQDMFRSHEDVLSDAYRIQESRIAYTVPEAGPTTPLPRDVR